MPIEVRISESAGFCWGVERALQVAREAGAGAEEPIDTLGPLIHNPAVIADLAAQGIRVIDDAKQKTAGTLIIRSHGVQREVMEDIAARAIAVVDATCTFVKAAQEKAAHLREQGYLVVVVGEPDHPEVLGIRSYAGANALVVETPADLPSVFSASRVGVVVQTTQSQERLAAIVAALAPRVKELLVHNTICSATEKRQRAAVAMAASVDAVVVVGGRNSGNTSRLAELCAAVQPRTHHVESAAEIRPEWLTGVGVVGVTAGASTPRDQIEAVVERLKELVP
jgi:4-hydroxy-3-methylbut-2-enyl diphosphate reductase